MNAKHITLITLLVISGILISLNNRRLQTNLTVSSSPIPTDSALPTPSLNPNCIPTFVDGGGPYYQANSPFRTNIAPEVNTGQKLIVSGKVLKSDCQVPAGSVVIDIWQANESGNYEDEWYRGQVTTQSDGSYYFETVIPLGYGQGTAYRPPHIHFKVWDGQREIITSQMFLPAARNQQIDEAYIVKLDKQTTDNGEVYYATHDIILPE
ncbi:MAG TPA: hypothetical protein VD999_06565 [Vitreimonas sp.]|nr:hypothetical protein [Vitreimonas sp.]